MVRVVVYSALDRQRPLLDLFLSHSPLQYYGMVRSYDNPVISNLFQKNTTVLVRKNKSVEQNFVKSKCYCLGKKIWLWVRLYNLMGR